jgi:hypothetical protein
MRIEDSKDSGDKDREIEKVEEATDMKKVMEKEEVTERFQKMKNVPVTENSEDVRK